jgi:hypothetical protein
MSQVLFRCCDFRPVSSARRGTFSANVEGVDFLVSVPRRATSQLRQTMGRGSLGNGVSAWDRVKPASCFDVGLGDSDLLAEPLTHDGVLPVSEDVEHHHAGRNQPREGNVLFPRDTDHLPPAGCAMPRAIGWGARRAEVGGAASDGYFDHTGSRSLGRRPMRLPTA